MTRDELRILAGITSGLDAEGVRSFSKKVDEASGPLVPSFTVNNDDNAGKTAVALAKAGITVDMEYAMDAFYFNFKTESIAEHAEKIMNRVIDKSKE